MVIVSLLLIPEPIAAFWVFFTIISINIGILGFMTFWGIRLDFISMVILSSFDIIFKIYNSFRLQS